MVIRKNYERDCDNIPEKNDYLVADDLYDGCKIVSEEEDEEEPCKYEADTSVEAIERDFGVIPKLEELEECFSAAKDNISTIAEKLNEDILEDITTLIANVQLIRNQVLIGKVNEADGNLALLQQDMEKKETRLKNIQ